MKKICQFRISLSIILALLLILPFVTPVYASQSIEQQINIINSDATSGGNSNGMVLLDTTKYTNATYYFEVIAKVSNGTGSVDLNYNAGTGDSSVGGSTMTINNITSTTFTRYRSAAFTPTGAQNAHIKNITCSGCTLTIHAARIIIVQSSSSVITDTETQIDIGEFSTTFTNSTDTPAQNAKLWQYVASKYSDITHVYFEATIQENNPASGTAYESLYQAGTSCTNQVSGSEVSTNINNIRRERSGDILSSLTDGTGYMICARTSPAGKILEKGARIIIDQSNQNGITNMEIPQTYNVDKITNSTTTLTNSLYNNLFEIANWSGFTITYLLQATIRSSKSSATNTTQLCYATSSNCDTLIGNTITTSSTNNTLVTSSSFSQPPDGKEIDIGLSTSNSGDNVSIAKGELLIDLAPLSTTTAPAQTSSQTVSSSGPDPNIKSGWKKKIVAGPHHIGTAKIITAANASSLSSIPAGVFIEDTATHIDVDVSIQKQDIASLPTQPSPIPFPWQQGLNIAGDVYQYNALSSFNGYPVNQFDKPVTIILSYDPQQLYGLSPNVLRIAYLDQQTNTWKVISENTVINTQTHSIANTTNQFSYFTVVYPAPRTSISSEKATLGAAITPTLPPLTSEPVSSKRAPARQHPIVNTQKHCFFFLCLP